MRREATDVRMMGARHETIDDSHVSGLGSKAARVSRITSHALSPDRSQEVS
jgi:hypothetical protein